MRNRVCLHYLAVFSEDWVRLLNFSRYYLKCPISKLSFHMLVASFHALICLFFTDFQLVFGDTNHCEDIIYWSKSEVNIYNLVHLSAKAKR